MSEGNTEFYRLRHKLTGGWSDFYAHEYDLIVVPKKPCECEKPHWKKWKNGSLYCTHCGWYQLQPLNDANCTCPGDMWEGDRAEFLAIARKCAVHAEQYKNVRDNRKGDET